MNKGQEDQDALRETNPVSLPPLAPPDVYDPVIEAYKKDVDRTLIRENLKLTHEQRLKKLQSAADALAELQSEAKRRLRARVAREHPGVYGDEV